MSLTSYRAAPPRDRVISRAVRDIVNGIGMGSRERREVLCSPASMPGDDLLFHRLSDSTIGAVRFHGRVRDGIGWGTDAIATKQ